MIKFEKHIPLSLGQGSGLYGVDTTSASYVEPAYVSYAQIDVSKYTSGLFYFEAVIKTSAATAYATLYNVTGAAVVSGAEVTTTSTSIIRLRSSALSLSGSDTYVDRIKNDGANTTTHYGCRVVVEQSAPAIFDTETQISLFSYTTNTTTSASYVIPGTIGATFFQNTSANWNGVLTTYFEAVMKTSAATAYAECQTVIGGSVSGSEITTTSTSFVRVRSGAITLANASEYRAMIKNDGANTTSFNSARLIIQQSGSPTKSECHLPISMTVVAASATLGSYLDMQGRMYYDPAKWSVDSVTWNAEATANWGGATGNGLRVYDIDAAGALSGSVCAPPGSSTSRVKSSSVTMPVAAHTFRAEVDSAGATHYVGIPKMIATLTWTNVVQGGSFFLANIEEL